ncbi:MAG: ribonuclease P protein component [Candidatus Dormibacterales bacterium]
MKKRSRISSGVDFERVMSASRVHAGTYLVAFAAPRPDGAGGRVGVATSRRVRGAVPRNRARRRLREAARLGLLVGWEETGSGIRYDVVLIARPDLLAAPFAAIAEEVRAVRRRLDAART